MLYHLACIEKEDGAGVMKAFLKNKKLVLLFFGAIVLIQYLIMGHSPFLRIPGWPSQELTISYPYGFVRRGLMGSLVAIMSQLFHVELFTMILFVQLLGTAVFVGLLFFFFYLVMKESDNTSVVIMILLFLAMGGIGFYFADWGEMDIFMLSVTIIACMLIIKDKYVWLIPFLAAVCVMIHEGYVLMYLGIILALLLYRVTVETDERKKKKYWLCLFSTGLIAAVLFIYFYFFSVSVSKNHIDEIIVNSEIFLQSQVYTRNLKYIYEGTALPNCAMWVDGAPTPNFFIRMFAVVLNILVCLPVISIIVDFWKMVLKNYADSKKTRLISKRPIIDAFKTKMKCGTL